MHTLKLAIVGMHVYLYVCMFLCMYIYNYVCRNRWMDKLHTVYFCPYRVTACIFWNISYAYLVNMYTKGHMQVPPKHKHMYITTDKPATMGNKRRWIQKNKQVHTVIYSSLPSRCGDWPQAKVLRSTHRVNTKNCCMLVAILKTYGRQHGVGLGQTKGSLASQCCLLTAFPLSCIACTYHKQMQHTHLYSHRHYHLPSP